MSGVKRWRVALLVAWVAASALARSGSRGGLVAGVVSGTGHGSGLVAGVEGSTGYGSGLVAGVVGGTEHGSGLVAGVVGGTGHGSGLGAAVVAVSGGTGVNGSCLYWCKTPRGQSYCCEDDNQSSSYPSVKPGRCPPVRPQCPPVRSGFRRPNPCSDDSRCPGRQKCCYDTCLDHHTCKPPRW